MKKRRNKREKNKNKKNVTKRISTPEDFLFGFLVAVSLVFSLLCVRSVGQIPVSSPSLAKEDTSAKEKQIRKLIKGYPIEKMTPYISKKDEKVAAFLVAIAKKESNWGVYSPKKNGRECYNYWGYRGQENPTPSGYSCFSSPQQAVNIVGKRINNLVAQKVDTPREMVLWKCGDGCTRSGARGEAKWVRDVEFFYKKIL
ncbi:MAG: hypothetical protein A3J76_02965 [Candidatus Moranbacteria bacterium RBG_13_45_13]|nr:MAG: hypothetical protein A3J76_02965 [Candidatus Moranbacteria bacterium RBG_13_45_13]